MKMRKSLFLLLMVLCCLAMFTACSADIPPSESSDNASNTPSSNASINSSSLQGLIVGEWEHANSLGERLVWIFRADGTCEDYAPDYEDPYYGSHMNCTYYIGNDSLTNSPNSLILKYLDDDGEEAEEDYLWNSEGSRMQWYVTADTLRIGGFEYTRK